MPIPTILRGEDSTARGRPISINLPEGDYAGLTVRFNLLGVMRDGPSPASGVPLVVRLSADETARFPLGTHFAAISVTNADGIGYVLTNTQRIRVTDTPRWRRRSRLPWLASTTSQPRPTRSVPRSGNSCGRYDQSLPPSPSPQS